MEDITMFKKLATLSPVVILLLFAALMAWPALATAQDANEKAPASAKTVTGCLQKGVEPNGGFYLITSKNKHLELYDNGSVSLADHVGHTVEVTGSAPHRTAEQEKVSQPYEKQETGTRKHADFEVSSLKMVSETCSQ
jgi:ABC-type enterochelin transport system substrate-binding protein